LVSIACFPAIVALKLTQKFVCVHYGFNPDDDLLEDLLTFNLELAEKEQRGEAIVDPWAPQ